MLANKRLYDVIDDVTTWILASTICWHRSLTWQALNLYARKTPKFSFLQQFDKVLKYHQIGVVFKYYHIDTTCACLGLILSPKTMNPTLPSPFLSDPWHKLLLFNARHCRDWITQGSPLSTAYHFRRCALPKRQRPWGLQKRQAASIMPYHPRDAIIHVSVPVKKKMFKSNGK